MSYDRPGYEALTDETNNLRVREQGTVSCAHYRSGICHKCMDTMTGFKSGVHLNDAIRPVFWNAFINRGQDVAPGIEPKPICDCGDKTNHSH